MTISASFKPVHRAVARLRGVHLGRLARVAKLRLFPLMRFAGTGRDWAMGVVLGSYVSFVQASIFGKQLCTIFTGVADNQMYSVLAGLGLAGLLVAHSLDEGDNKLKTSGIRIGLAATGLVNLQTLSTLVTGANWGC
jgi:hypothetical protein